MKGPGLRLDLDVRRVWRCAKCGKVVRTPGHVTAQRCGCCEPVQWMHLEPAVKKEPFRAPVREHLPEPWEIEETATAAGISPPVAESTATSEPVAASTPDQSPELPAPDTASTIVVEIVTTDIVEIVADAPAPAPAAAAPDTPDTFGAGVDDSPPNPDKT